MTICKPSAHKHGYTRRDIQRVLDNPIDGWETTGRRGNTVIARVGFASNMDIIEILFEYDARGNAVVFHADISSG